MRRVAKSELGEDDLRYQFRVMVRWCRIFHRADVDWVMIAAARFRERHPILDLATPARMAA